MSILLKKEMTARSGSFLISSIRSFISSSVIILVVQGTGLLEGHSSQYIFI